MLIKKLSLRGFTTFRDEVTLDLAALGPGIIAVAGPNGAGKTTLLESIPGGIYRTTPSRGSIAALAVDRDAFIEIHGVNGNPFSVRLDCDNRNGKQEGCVFDGEGNPLAGPKVREMDKYVSEHFAPLEVYLASMFASQTGVGSVLRMSQSDRRKLFGRLLGLERLELLAEQARARARATESEMTASRAALDAIRQGAGDVKALERECAEAKERAETAEHNEKEAQARLEAAKAELARLTGLAEAAEKAAAALKETERRVAAATAAYRRLETEAECLLPTLSKAAEIRAAAEKLARLERDLEVHETRVKALDEKWLQSAALAAEALERCDGAETRRDEITARLRELDSILSRAPEIRAVAEELKTKAARLEEIREAGEGAAEAERESGETFERARLKREEAARANEAADRAVQDAEAREGEAEDRLARAEESTAAVPCAGILEDNARGACPALVGHFQTRDEAKRILTEIAAGHKALMDSFQLSLEAKKKAEEEALAAFNRHKEAKARAAVLRADYAALRKEIDRLRAGDKSAELDRAEAEAGVLRQNLEEARLALDAAGRDHDRLNQEAAALAKSLDEAKLALESLRKQAAGLKAADRLPALEAAERAAAELRGRIGAARAALAEEDARLTAAGRAAEAAPTVNPEELDSARADIVNEVGGVETLGLEAENAREDAVVLSTRLKAAREAQAKAEALAAKLAPLETDLAEWRWLGRGLGREGVQALELDAAGPRVSTLANELLADAYGSRFQLRLETMAAKKDKGTREVFDVVVCDTERGREGNGEDLSGGEKVIVGEALGLGIGLFHAESAGVGLGTVCRDETVGALDPENGERYIAMLKSFLRVGRVHQLLYVCHSPTLTDMADAVVRVENGHVSVEAR